ncbi:hypothetical protein PR003_g15709 [Phytophthora rubi]|uniref:Uncharacterized protein n=1 Tax=Phytophthora rubi TaxID=129364 RepID=A0A6A4EX34_9STRA|nr:hypothetical protein PR001_g14935 [Phytophthora rubi]KAE9328781.1 hypothetical protein PR003_g15709 [Phytophthora rubi]
MPLLALDPSPSEAEVRRASDAHAHLDFLKQAMALDVTDGDARGAEAILEQWRLFSLCHGDVSVQLQRLELVSDESILAVTNTSITITDNTLQVLYPHLTGTDGFAAAGKLLNKRLEVEGSVHSTGTKLAAEWCGSSPRWT